MSTMWLRDIPFASQAALVLALATPARAVERQRLNGHCLPATATIQPLRRLPADTRLNLVIGLPLRNQEELLTLLEQLYDPASPQYRYYLTAEEFAEQFGPTQEDYRALSKFAKSHGLTMTATYPNRTLLDVSGTVEEIERAFHVRMQVYQHPTEARTFHAPDVEPSIDLAVPVLHISGLNDFSRPRSARRHKPSGHAGLKPASGGSAPGGGFWGNDFRAAYVPGVALTGTGQSIALVEFDGFYPSDVADYQARLLITLTYFLAVVPVSLLLRLAARTPNESKGAARHWLHRNPPVETIEAARRQFE